MPGQNKYGLPFWYFFSTVWKVRGDVVFFYKVVVVQKVSTRTGSCCTPSTISCHSYCLASHQVLHDLALSCTICHKK